VNIILNAIVTLIEEGRKEGLTKEDVTLWQIPRSANLTALV